MDLLPNQEQEQIVDAITAFLEKESPVQRLIGRAPSAPLTDRAMWAHYGQLGWVGLGVSEQDGGVGYSLVEETLLFREAGRYLLSPSLLSTMLAARLAIAAGKSDMAASLLSGNKVACWAAPRAGAQAAPKVSGAFQLFEREEADYAVAIFGGQAALIDIADFDDVQPTPCMDETVSLAYATAKDIAPLIASAEQYGPLSQEANIMIAAIMSGMASGACDLAVDYAKLREQFGKQIGAFQAIKHMCSDMAVRSEAATAQTTYAVLAAEASQADVVFQIASAGVLASQAAHLNAAANVQIHGGIGYTAEHAPHLYVKRSHVMDCIGGGQRSRLRQALEADAAV